jgi:hypothetical protein
VLLVACSAVVAGCSSFAAIGQWTRNVPQAALARLGARINTVLGVRVAPSAATIRRVIIGGLSRRADRPARSRPDRRQHPRSGWQDRPRLAQDEISSLSPADETLRVLVMLEKGNPFAQLAGTLSVSGG